MIEHLCENCSTHFDAVRKNLDLLGVEYKVNKFMVRGLDYYVRTTFEFVTDQLGAQSAVCAGGRYDGLIELLGGQTRRLEFAKTPPTVILLAGLQGSGKTTTTAKIALRLNEREKKKAAS